MSVLDELFEEHYKDPNWQKQYEEYKKIALDPKHIQETNEYFDRVDREYVRQMKVFYRYYKKLLKIVPKDTIYCDDEYAHRLNFFIEDRNFDLNTRFKIDKLTSEMYKESDTETLVPFYSILIIPKNIFDAHNFRPATKFFKHGLENIRIIELNTGGKVNEPDKINIY